MPAEKYLGGYSKCLHSGGCRARVANNAKNFPNARIHATYAGLPHFRGSAGSVARPTLFPGSVRAVPAYPVFGVLLIRATYAGLPHFFCPYSRNSIPDKWKICNKKTKVKALQGLYLLTKRVAHTTRKAHDKPKNGLKVGARGLEPPNLTDVNRAL